MIYKVDLVIPCSDGEKQTVYCIAESEKKAELKYFDCFGVRAKELSEKEIVRLLNDNS